MYWANTYVAFETFAEKNPIMIRGGEGAAYATRSTSVTVWNRLLRLPLPRHPLRLCDLGGCHHRGQDVAFVDGTVAHVFIII